MLSGTKEKRWTAEDWDQVKQKLFMEKNPLYWWKDKYAYWYLLDGYFWLNYALEKENCSQAYIIVMVNTINNLKAYINHS